MKKVRLDEAIGMVMAHDVTRVVPGEFKGPAFRRGHVIRKEDVPVLGAPAATIYNPATVLDLILPRVLAEEKISREDIVELGHGGLCLNCEKCTFPVCPFGK